VIKDNLKILLFSTKGAGTHYYGPGMSAYRMYKGYDSENISLSLVHGFAHQENLPVFNEQFFISNLKSRSLFSGFIFSARLKKWISTNIKQFDVVHCLGGYHASFIMAKLSEDRGVPAFIKITESVNTGFNKSSTISNILGLRKYRLKYANHISGYISISSRITKQLTMAGIYSSKIHEIPNGVDVNRFRPLSGQEKKSLRKKMGIDDIFTIIFTGGFSNRKHPYLIVKAFEKYYNTSQIQLLLIGPDRDFGEERHRIQNILSAKNVQNVKLLPFTNNIKEYYQISDIFVLPSSEEGLSNSMLEAQACGLPAVVTKISGSEDLIDEQFNGTFVTHDEKSIINGIDRYFNNPDTLTTHSLNARIKIVQNYSAESVFNKHIELFSKAKNQ